MKNNLKPIILISYFIIFGSIIGFYQYPSTPKMFWIILALIGSCGNLYKFKYIRNRDLKLKLIMHDIISIIAIIALCYLIPNIIGLVKYIIISIIAALYINNFILKNHLLDQNN